MYSYTQCDMQRVTSSYHHCLLRASPRINFRKKVESASHQYIPRLPLHAGHNHYYLAFSGILSDQIPISESSPIHAPIYTNSKRKRTTAIQKKKKILSPFRLSVVLPNNHHRRRRESASCATLLDRKVIPGELRPLPRR